MGFHLFTVLAIISMTDLRASKPNTSSNLRGISRGIALGEVYDDRGTTREAEVSPTGSLPKSRRWGSQLPLSDALCLGENSSISSVKEKIKEKDKEI